jgi:hypothetical protein
MSPLWGLGYYGPIKFPTNVPKVKPEAEGMEPSNIFGLKRCISKFEITLYRNVKSWGTVWESDV